MRWVWLSKKDIFEFVQFTYICGLQEAVLEEKKAKNSLSLIKATCRKVLDHSQDSIKN